MPCFPPAALTLSPHRAAMERQTSYGSADSGSSGHRGRLMFTVLSALAQSNALAVPTPEHWQGYGTMLPPPRADVDAALAASAYALRRSSSDASSGGCSECGQRGRQQSARVSSAADGDAQGGCPHCKERAQTGGCFPVLRRKRRVSPQPAAPATST
jgi:hypothetical protein